MTHQPYEAWLYDSHDLTWDQKQALREHLQECAQCSTLQHNWESVQSMMKKSSMASPMSGFTQRWQLNLAARRELRQRTQVWRFFLLLAGVAALCLVILSLQITVTESPTDLLISTFRDSVVFLTQSAQVILALVAWLRIIPPAVTLISGAFLIALFGLLFMVWVWALLHISRQGVHKNEISI